MSAALKVAIVGSGPAGCYTAERLGKLCPGGQVDVLDRLPTPFGLVRAGVAADHQGTKAIARVLGRSLSRPPVAFWGNIAVGRDLSLSELRALYDVVVIASGAAMDRELGLPGEDLPGVIGSWAFTAWCNGHPDYAELAPPLEGVESAVVIGNGNVAIDVARILGKTAEELAASDLSPEVSAELAKTRLREMHIVGRRGPAQVKFTPAELAELGRLSRLAPQVLVEDLETAEGGDPAVIETLAAFAALEEGAKPLTLHFDFNLRPEAFEGDGRLEAVRFQRTLQRDGELQATGERVTIPAQLAVTCIGYRCLPLDGLEPRGGFFPNEGGRIEPGLHVAGWAARGPSGTIATNRPEGHGLAERIAAEAVPEPEKAGRDGLVELLRARALRWVDYADWQAIDAAEAARAQQGRPRRKFTRLSEMLDVIDEGL